MCGEDPLGLRNVIGLPVACLFKRLSAISPSVLIICPHRVSTSCFSPSEETLITVMEMTASASLNVRKRVARRPSGRNLVAAFRVWRVTAVDLARKPADLCYHRLFLLFFFWGAFHSSTEITCSGKADRHEKKKNKTWFSAVFISGSELHRK